MYAIYTPDVYSSLVCLLRRPLLAEVHIFGCLRINCLWIRQRRSISDCTDVRSDQKLMRNRLRNQQFIVCNRVLCVPLGGDLSMAHHVNHPWTSSCLYTRCTRCGSYGAVCRICFGICFIDLRLINPCLICCSALQWFLVNSVDHDDTLWPLQFYTSRSDEVPVEPDLVCLITF